MKPEDFKIEMTDEVREQLASDPDKAAAMREFTAAFRQALQSVNDGQHQTIDDALEAILGARPVKIDPETGEQIPGATMQADMERAGGPARFAAGMLAHIVTRDDEDD